jgi:hypothetical protein
VSTAGATVPSYGSPEQCFEELIGFFQISHFTFQVLDPLPLGRGRPGNLLGIDLGLNRPLTRVLHELVGVSGRG